MTEYKDTRYIEQFPRSIISIIKHIHHFKYIKIREDTPIHFMSLLLQLEQLGILDSHFDTDDDYRVFYDRENMVHNLWLNLYSRLKNNEFFIEDEIKIFGRSSN